MQLESVTETIAGQVSQQFNIAGCRLVQLHPEALRFSFAELMPGSRYLNADVSYERGIDLYTLELHLIERATLAHTTERLERVFCEDIGQLIAAEGPELAARLIPGGFRASCEVISLEIPDHVPSEWL